MKRVRDEPEQNVPKKVKVDPGETIQTAVGHNRNIDKRHTRQLQSLIALVPSVKSKIQVTDDKLEVLQKCKPNMGIYLEWLKKKDTYFLWGSIADKGLMVKFEFHGGFQAVPNILDIKNPLLAFSNGFDAGSWIDVKELLQKLFGHTNDQKIQCHHDFLFAFTRTKEVLHFRVFKIHEFPTSENKNQSMRLQRVFPVFILKPLEIHRRDLEGGSEGYIIANTFFDEDRFMFAEGQDPFIIDQHTAYSGDSSHPVVSHVLQNCGSLVMLPLPTDSIWLGFNSSFKEFFERYHVLREVSIPGTGTGSNLRKYKQLTHSYRVFMRSLIMEIGEAFGRDCCFSDFTEENIFLRRGRAAILGVKQVRYTHSQARKNWKVIFDIMKTTLTIFPKEAQRVFWLLAVATASHTSDDPDHDARSLYPILVNNFAWMDALDKLHMVCDLYEEFMTFLDPGSQLTAAEEFPGLKDWEKKFSNNLLDAVRVNNLKEKYRFDQNAYEKWKENKGTDLEAIWKMNPGEGLKLLNGKMYFGGLRNSYTHLPEQGRKARTPLKLPPEAVDAIVSSDVGEMGPAVQQKVPGAFPFNDPRRSYERFGRYFRCVSDAEFDSGDEK